MSTTQECSRNGVNDKQEEEDDKQYRKRKRKSRPECDSDSSSSEDSYERRKRKIKKHKKRRKCNSTVGDISSDEDHRRKQKHKHKKRKNDLKNRKVGVDNNNSPSLASSVKEQVRRSVITGKKIKMHIEKTEDDLQQEQARKDLLRFMNSSF